MAFPEADRRFADPARLFFGGRKPVFVSDDCPLSAEELLERLPDRDDALGSRVDGAETPPTATPTSTPLENFKQEVYRQLSDDALAEIYRLTGNSSTDWMEARDPSSETGDKNPSAGVSTGKDPVLPRGFFHSFHEDVTMNPFDYLIRHRPSEFPDFHAAAKYLSTLTGVPWPTQSQEPRVAGFRLLKVMPVADWLHLTPEEPASAIENLLETLNVGGLIGDGGVGKGWFLLTYGLLAAVGRSAFPSFPVSRPKRIALFTSEDNRSQLHRRAHAICSHYSMSAEEKALIESNLRLFAECDGPLVSADMPEGTDRYREMLDFVTEWKHDVLMIDPKSRWSGLKEDSNTDQCLFVSKLEQLAIAGECGVLVSHHTGILGRGRPLREGVD